MVLTFQPVKTFFAGRNLQFRYSRASGKPGEGGSRPAPTPVNLDSRFHGNNESAEN
jgi:hypothetical protein